MKSLFDQFHKIFGVRLDAVFPLIVGVVVVLMFVSLSSKMDRLNQELGDLQHAQNSVSTLSRSDLNPVTTGLNQANGALKQLGAQSAVLADKLPAIENELNLANQKLTFLESGKTPVDPKQLAPQH